MTGGDRLTVTIDKPATGGRMIARHDGAVLLVSGAIPGEVVEVEVERVQRRTVWARTRHVLEPSADRVAAPLDSTCGGNVLAHVRYDRQVQLKREIIRDTFTRLGRLDTPGDLPVVPSAVEGYRTRARFHVVNGRIGFFREGTHQLCDPAVTGQLLASSLETLSSLEAALKAVPRAEVREVELAENCPADQRALHLLAGERGDPSSLTALPRVAGTTGLSYGVGTGRPFVLSGVPEVTDTISVDVPPAAFTVTLTRQAHSFFQGNRYLLAPLVAAVVAETPPGRVLDLYAGVGLLSIAVARRGDCTVVAVEGDRTSARDLKTNAARAGSAVDARHQSVESFLQGSRGAMFDTVLLDPPRSGLTAQALAGAVGLRVPRVVYLSCDPATLARDARRLADSGYRLQRLRAFDLFPRTAHIETLAVFER